MAESRKYADCTLPPGSYSACPAFNVTRVRSGSIRAYSARGRRARMRLPTDAGFFAPSDRVPSLAPVWRAMPRRQPTLECRDRRVSRPQSVETAGYSICPVRKSLSRTRHMRPGPMPSLDAPRTPPAAAYRRCLAVAEPTAKAERSTGLRSEPRTGPGSHLCKSERASGVPRSGLERNAWAGPIPLAGGPHDRGGFPDYRVDLSEREVFAELAPIEGAGPSGRQHLPDTILLMSIVPRGSLGS